MRYAPPATQKPKRCFPDRIFTSVHLIRAPFMWLLWTLWLCWHLRQNWRRRCGLCQHSCYLCQNPAALLAISGVSFVQANIKLMGHTSILAAQARRFFDALDTDGDGWITFKDLNAGLRKRAEFDATRAKPISPPRSRPPLPRTTPRAVISEEAVRCERVFISRCRRRHRRRSALIARSVLLFVSQV